MLLLSGLLSGRPSSFSSPLSLFLEPHSEGILLAFCSLHLLNLLQALASAAAAGGGVRMDGSRSRQRTIFTCPADRMYFSEKLPQAADYRACVAGVWEELASKDRRRLSANLNVIASCAR
ncbi:hypothetical protein MRB53_041068 [Persea americana]|nr:hypothetical protein MRB53_041068 [Persea americana]